MPELSKDLIEKASDWEIQDGIYEMELVAVQDQDTRTKEPLVGKDSGVPYWRWVFEFPEDANGGKYKRRQITKVISLGESSEGMRVEAYAAFGVPYGSQTDKIIEKGGRAARCLVKVTVGEYGGVPKPEAGRLMPLASTSSNKGAPSNGKAKVAEESSKY